MWSWPGCPEISTDCTRRRTALDCAGAVTASAVAAGVLFGAQRAAVDGAAQLQPVVSLVRGLGDRRCGMEPRGVQQEP